MNKFTKAGIAGAAALAIAAGGGTYALWSDYYVDGGNNIGADRLAIEVEGVGTNAVFNKLDLAPGEKFDQENVITGRVGGADINVAKAYVSFTDLTDTDNGCGSQSENDVDNCESPSDSGELSQNTHVVVHRYDADCTSNLTRIVKSESNTTLAQLASQPRLFIGDMSDGQQYCLKMTIAIPEGTMGSNNIVMTDRSTFSMKYDLEQVPNA